jgi:hypothetical protein
MQKTAYARGVLDNLMGYDRDGDMAEYAITVSRMRREFPPPAARAGFPHCFTSWKAEYWDCCGIASVAD